MWPFLTVCHHGTDINFMRFCMSLQNRPQLLCPSSYMFNSRTILFNINSDSFNLYFNSVGLMVSLLQAKMKISIEDGKMVSFLKKLAYLCNKNFLENPCFYFPLHHLELLQTQLFPVCHTQVKRLIMRLFLLLIGYANTNYSYLKRLQSNHNKIYVYELSNYL